MVGRGRELTLFGVRWLVLVSALGFLYFIHRSPTFLPLLPLLGGLGAYGLVAAGFLYAWPEGFAPFLFLVLDTAWIFIISMEAGSQSGLYSWLFILPLASAPSSQEKGKLSVALFFSVLFLLVLQYGNFFFPKFSPPRTEFQDFLAKLLVFLGVVLSLMIYSGKKEEEQPVLKLRGEPDDRTDDYNRKLKQLSTEMEYVTKQLYDKMRQQSILYEIIGHITHTLDLEKVLELTVKRCKEELRGEIGFLMLAEGNDVQVRYSDGLFQPAFEVFQSKVGDKPFGEQILTGDPVRESLKDESHPVLDCLVSLKNVQRIRDILTVPLKSPIPGIPARGLLGVANSLEEGGFTRNNLEMMTILAGQAVIAMDNAQMVANQKQFFMETIHAFAAAINQKHKYTHVLHSKSVAKWGMDIAREMGLSEEEIEKIEIAAILHDIGKIAIPDEILTKPGVLTPEELKIMQEHPDKGREILKGISMMEEIIPWVRAHHERWDGKGYPDGIVGEQIPLGAQIITVADAFDAMTANRPYHKGLTVQEAVEAVGKESGKQFSPKAVEAFLRVMKRRQETGIPLDKVPL